MNENLIDNKLDDDRLEKVSGGTNGSLESMSVYSCDGDFINAYIIPEADDRNIICVLCNGDKVERLSNGSFNNFVNVHLLHYGCIGWIEEKYIR